MKKSDKRLRLQSPEFTGTNKLSTNGGLTNGEYTSIPGLDSLSDCIWRRNSERFKSSLVTDYLAKNNGSPISSQAPQNKSYRNEIKGEFSPELKNSDQGSSNWMAERKSTQTSLSRKTSEPTSTFSCLKILHCFVENDSNSNQSKLPQDKLNNLEESPFPVNKSNDKSGFGGDQFDQAQDDSEVFYSCKGDNSATSLKLCEENKTFDVKEGSPVHSHQIESEIEYKDCETPSERNMCGPNHNSGKHSHTQDNNAELDQKFSNITEGHPATETEPQEFSNNTLNPELAKDLQLIAQHPEPEQVFLNHEIDLAINNYQRGDNKITEIPLSDKSESEFSVISEGRICDATGKAEMDLAHYEEANNSFQDCTLSDHGSEYNQSFEIIQENKEKNNNIEDHSSPGTIKDDPSKLEGAYNVL